VLSEKDVAVGVRLYTVTLLAPKPVAEGELAERLFASFEPVE
jgi:hypothetical protein